MAAGRTPAEKITRRLRTTRSLSLSATPRDAKLREPGGDGFSVRRRTHELVEVLNAAVGADVKRPARCILLIRIDNAVRGGDTSIGIAQQRVIDAERLREGLIGLWRIDADGEVRRVELPNLVATLTE